MVLGGCLDDQLRALEVVVVRRALDQRERRVLLRAGQLLLLDQPVEAGADGAEALVDGCLRDVDHHDVHADDRAGLGNAVAHRSGANDADGLDAHGNTPWRRGGGR
ncbi:Uncharacterised protein [Streptococcus dysgalactiae subsp. equisimilis]|nr:Uncharacterised protein [Streptococcus dysgalactiae subsp. equisimilis]